MSEEVKAPSLRSLLSKFCHSGGSAHWQHLPNSLILQGDVNCDSVEEWRLKVQHLEKMGNWVHMGAVVGFVHGVLATPKV